MTVVARKVDRNEGIWAEVYREDDGFNIENPMRDWDWDGHVALVSRYAGYGTDDSMPDTKGHGLGVWMRALRMAGGVAVPVYVYDHSGVAFSTGAFGDRWDSGVAGAAWMPAGKVKGVFGGDKEAAAEALEEMVRLMDAYAQGEVYGMSYGNIGETETDGCGGYFMTGTWDGMLDEMAGYFHQDDPMRKLIMSAEMWDVEEMPEKDYRQIRIPF